MKKEELINIVLNAKEHCSNAMLASRRKERAHVDQLLGRIFQELSSVQVTREEEDNGGF